MAAKQLLQLAVNKATEAEALAILQRSGLIFKTVATECGVDENGQMVNEHGQVVTVNVGQVSGLIFPEPVIRDPVPFPKTDKPVIAGFPKVGSVGPSGPTSGPLSPAPAPVVPVSNTPSLADKSAKPGV